MTGQPAALTPPAAARGERDAASPSAPSPLVWALFAALFVGGAVVTTIAAGVWFAPERNGAGMTGTFLAGAVTFILAVGGLVALFHALGMTNNRFPLGLPDGTVQALIALILILLFFILAVFLYTDVSRATQVGGKLTGLTAEQLSDIPATVVASTTENQMVIGVKADGEPLTETRYDVTLVGEGAPASEVAQEIARQLITSLGTLIAAIAAFYFGAKTIGGQRPEEPTTRSHDAAGAIEP